MHKHINDLINSSDYTIQYSMRIISEILIFKYVVVIKHTSLNHLRAHSRSILKGLYIIIKNQFLYGRNACDFYFQNPTAALYLSGDH